MFSTYHYPRPMVLGRVRSAIPYSQMGTGEVFTMTSSTVAISGLGVSIKNMTTSNNGNIDCATYTVILLLCVVMSAFQRTADYCIK